MNWNSEEENYDAFLLLVGANCDDAVSWFGNRDPRERQSEKCDQNISAQFKPQIAIQAGVITSASANGISEIKACLNGASVALDLYCFMISDSPGILGHFAIFEESIILGSRKCLRNTFHFLGNIVRKVRFDMNLPLLEKVSFRRIPIEPFIRPSCNVGSWLAAKCNDKVYIRSVAENINRILKDCHECFAVSTFLPGIIADDSVKRQEALNSLRCVLRIARAYNEISTNRIRLAEMVCGGLISGRRPMREMEAGQSQLCVVAGLISKAEATLRIQKALEEIAPELSEEIIVGLELEPGPLFALSNWDDLVRLAEALDSSGPLQKRFGFNCDISHWALADITPEMVIQDLANGGRVASRIVHSHISDFGKGHLGDLGPETVHDAGFFDRWLKAISSSYAQAEEQNLKPTRFISLEMELPESRGVLLDAISSTSLACSRLDKIVYTNSNT